jgi:hypothetical protein
MSGDIAQMKSMSSDIVQRKLRARDSQLTKPHEITDDNDRKQKKYEEMMGKTNLQMVGKRSNSFTS